MAIYNQDVLTQQSDLTYVTNNNNEITAADVRALNQDWISSSVLIPMTSSMSVATASYALTASYVEGGSILTASYALTASYVTNAFTASYILNAVSSSYALSASYAANVPATASYALQALSSSFATTSSFAVSSSRAVSASRADTAFSSSYALSASFASNAVIFPFTGSAVFSGSVILTGSFSSRVFSGSVSSNTCSIDLRSANYFTVTIPDAVNTFFNISNPQPGQTANIVVTTGINCSASFSSNVKQPSGSFYTPTADPATDVLSLVCVNTSDILLVKAKMFI